MGGTSGPKTDQLELGAFASLAFGVVGDAMGTPTENLEPEQIEAKFGWVETFEGDGTDDFIMRNLIADALIATGGYANADDWASEWMSQQKEIFGEKVGRFFPSVLHSAAKLRYGDTPRTIATGNMPELELGDGDRAGGNRQCGHPRAAAAQAMELASLIHVTDVAFCQDGAAAIAAAVATALDGHSDDRQVIESAVCRDQAVERTRHATAHRGSAGARPHLQRLRHLSRPAITSASDAPSPATAARRSRRRSRSAASRAETPGRP